MIEPGWAGRIQFHELVFGTWLAYAFLVLLWERALRERLPEWQYVLITFLGASFFWINHYFQYAPFWFWLVNGYTIIFLLVYFSVCVRGRARTVIWKVGATLSAIVFTVAYIVFEMVGRYIVQSVGLHEFWVMLAAYFGFLGLIAWRARAA